MRQINTFLFCVIFLLIYFAYPIYGQFDFYSLEQGLSQANVRCILQDRAGFLWLGTQDALNRFDGYQFTKFRKELKNQNSLSGNFISSIAEDKKGKIVIGTINGVTIYDPRLNQFKRLTFKDSVYNINKIGSVSSVLCAKDGSLWIGEYYSGLIKTIGNKTVRFMNEIENPNSISSNYITALCEDFSGNIWIGTFGSGVSKYNISTKKFEHLYFGTGDQHQLSSNFINSLCVDKKGNLFIGTTDGLDVLDIKTSVITIYKNSTSADNSISGNNIISIYCDKRDNIWLAIEGNGVNLFDVTKKIFSKVHIESKNDPAGEEKNVISIFEDINNNIWFGTSTNGVIKWKKNRSSFRSLTQKINRNYLSNYSVRSIFIDRENNIWIGTDYGLNKILVKSGNVKKYFHNISDKTSINDNRIWAITEDRNGGIWIGTQRGLAFYDKHGDAFQRFVNSDNTKEALPLFIIRSLYFDSDNLLWFGTYGGGLYSFDIKKNEFVNHTFNISNPDAKKDVVIFQIYEDNDEKLWLVAPSGLACYDKETKNYERFFSDSQNNNPDIQFVLYSLLAESDSVFWIGTLGDGLIKFDYSKKQYKIFTEKNGLANNVVYGMLKDNKGNLWLSTNYGISKFDTKTEQFKNYDRNDGLPTDEFNTGAFAMDKKRNFYFGGIEGLLIFSPDSISNSTYEPNIAVTNFKVFNKAIFQNKVYFDREEINLGYKENFFSFEIASLDLTSSPKNEYAYMLDGYDKNWIYSRKRRYAAYTDVEPGEYVLKVKASNNDRFWNEAGIQLRLTITPPFWLTLWFQSLTIGILITSIIFVVRRQLNKIQKEKEIQQNFTRQLIESQENERMRIASELHDSVGQNLVVIKNRAILGVNNPSTQKEQIEEILALTSETISEVRGISYNLRPYQLGKIGLTRAIDSVINNGIKSSQITFDYKIDDLDDAVSKENEIHLYRIIQECVGNSLKHSNAANVSLKILKKENDIIINYSDDGKGFDVSSEKNNPSGLGFSSLAERVKLLGGSMVIDSNPGQGTKIDFIISIKPGKIK
jgi:signal transduction histidine kinase/ligand-binding sensor domain-containing protein